jgi:hypothetical protein
MQKIARVSCILLEGAFDMDFSKITTHGIWGFVNSYHLT